MRRNEIILAIVFVASVLGAGFLAHVLQKQRADFSKSRGLTHKMPVAGFQKFLADVVWMRFLYYAGGNQLTAETAGEYERFIRLIIALDPEFYRAYYEGALMLGPVAPEKALKIVDLGDEHPRISKKWKLQMMGGQIIMRKQWHNHYSNKDMDLDEVARAHIYFGRAKNLPECMQSALNSYIRTKALGNKNGDPREMNELREWFEYWKNTRFAYEDFAEAGAGMATAEFAYDEGGGFYGDSDAVNERIINQIKKVAEKYIKPTKGVKKETRDAAEKLVGKVIADIFPNRQFDIESYIPYNTDAATSYRGTIEDPKDKTYMVELDAPSSYAVGLLTVKTRSGSASITVLIDGKEVDGLNKVPVGAEKMVFPALIEVVAKSTGKKPDKEKREVSEDRKILDLPPDTDKTETKVMVRKPLRANKGVAGSVIEIKVEDVKGAEDLSYVLKIYKGDYF